MFDNVGNTKRKTTVLIIIGDQKVKGNNLIKHSGTKPTLIFVNNILRTYPMKGHWNPKGEGDL